MGAAGWWLRHRVATISNLVSTIDNSLLHVGTYLDAITRLYKKTGAEQSEHYELF